MQQIEKLQQEIRLFNNRKTDLNTVIDQVQNAYQKEIKITDDLKETDFVNISVSEYLDDTFIGPFTCDTAIDFQKLKQIHSKKSALISYRMSICFAKKSDYLEVVELDRFNAKGGIK